MELKKNYKNLNEYKLINENHFLSLRKKLKNKEIYSKNNSKLKEYEKDIININIKEIESKIINEKIFNIYSNCNNEIPKLGYLMQMIIINNNNLIIYGLYNINEYLLNTNKSLFESKNLKIQFNENMFNYLFKIIDKYFEDNNILLLLTPIISKLCQFDNQYCILLNNNFYIILNIINQKLKSNDNQNYIKKNLFTIINNIFLLDNFNKFKNNFENNNKDFYNIILNELYNIKNNYFLISKKYILTLLSILNNIFSHRLYFSFIFKNANKIKLKEKNIFEIFKFFFKFHTTYELTEFVILCLYNFIEFYLENKDNLSEDEQDEINYRICNGIKINKFIVPLIYDNKENIINNDYKIYIFKILINTISFGDCEYWLSLIEKNIGSQIDKLQSFLLSIKIDNNSSLIFEYHLLLIFNLVATESEVIINNIAIKFPCISNLFNFFNSNNFYINIKLDLFLNIIHCLIKNRCKYRKKQHNFKYIKTLLLSEGICEFFKKLLLDEKSLNQELIKNIFIDILILIDYFEELNGNDKNNNIVILHFHLIGMNDIINNFKSNINLSTELINIVTDISDRIKIE